MLKPFVITFSGIDGAGKTTQIDKLTSYLESSGIPVQKLTLWDNVALFRSARSNFSRTVLQSDSAIGTPSRPAERRDKNAQNGFLLLGRCLLYILDLISLRKILRKTPRVAGGVIIFDRYMYDQLAALPMENWAARVYAKMLLPFIPKPDIGYILDAEPEIARARKPEYPLDFMHRYRASFLRLGKFAGLKVISAGTPEDVHLEILRQLTKYAPTQGAEREIDTELVA